MIVDDGKRVTAARALPGPARWELGLPGLPESPQELEQTPGLPLKLPGPLELPEPVFQPLPPELPGLPPGST